MMQVSWHGLRLNAMSDTEAAQWKKRFERERAARKSAEKLLEDKSLEIWTINQDLEKKIVERTIELQEALVSAEAANKAKDAFLSSMSHELRTPLNAIIGFSQILMAKSDTSETIKGFVEKIMISGKSLLSLVNTILDFSKIEAGKMDFHPEWFNLSVLLNEVQSIYEPLLIKKRLNCTVETNDIGSVFGDAQLIKQVLVNLIANAVKFSPYEGKITLSFCDDGTHIQIAIADEGDGFPSNKLNELFEPFSQLSNAKTVDEAGTGLGLMIVKKIVELHAGALKAENIDPKGAKIVIVIPQHEVQI